MLYSKVRVEFSEESSPGVFNVVAKESGTTGAIMLGIDLGEAVRAAPRPLLVLAEAIIDVYSSREDTSRTPPILEAAWEYVKRWKDYDEAVKRGANPLSLPWPDAKE
jgi:hypothetical protein